MGLLGKLFGKKDQSKAKKAKKSNATNVIIVDDNSSTLAKCGGYKKYNNNNIPAESNGNLDGLEGLQWDDNENELQYGKKSIITHVSKNVSEVKKNRNARPIQAPAPRHNLVSVVGNDRLQTLINMGSSDWGVDDAMKNEVIKAFFTNAQSRQQQTALDLAKAAYDANLINGEQRDAIVTFYTKYIHCTTNSLGEKPENFVKFLMCLVHGIGNTATAKHLLNGSNINNIDFYVSFERMVTRSLTLEMANDKAREYITPIKFFFKPTLQDYSAHLINLFNQLLPVYQCAPARFERLAVINGVITEAAGKSCFDHAITDYAKRYLNGRQKAKTLSPKDVSILRLLSSQMPQNDKLKSYIPIVEKLAAKMSRVQNYANIYSENGDSLNTVLQKDKGINNTREVEGEADENEVIADAYLNVDTNTDRRGSITAREIHNLQVGHTWLTLKPKQGALPADVVEDMKTNFNIDNVRATLNLIAMKGETAIGFWPAMNRELQRAQEYNKLNRSLSKVQNEEEAKQIKEKQYGVIFDEANADLMAAKGFSRGSGEQANAPLGAGFINEGPGKVEEPDYSHTPKARKQFNLTRKQFLKVYRYVEQNRNHPYTTVFYNCTTFALEALRAAGHDVHAQKKVCAYLPTGLYSSLYDEAKSDAKNNRQGDVQLLKLGENESHRSAGKGKVGENGENVRVHGVDKFNMVEEFFDPTESHIHAFEIASARGMNEMAAKARSYFFQQLFSPTNIRSQNEYLMRIKQADNVGMFTNQETANKLIDVFMNYKDNLKTFIGAEEAKLNDDEIILEYVKFITDVEGATDGHFESVPNYNKFASYRRDSLCNLSAKCFDPELTPEQVEDSLKVLIRLNGKLSFQNFLNDFIVDAPDMIPTIIIAFKLNLFTDNSLNRYFYNVCNENYEKVIVALLDLAEKNDQTNRVIIGNVLSSTISKSANPGQYLERLESIQKRNLLEKDTIAPTVEMLRRVAGRAPH